MTFEQLIFIKVISDHLNGRISEYMQDIKLDILDWNSLIKLANLHQVEGIIYKQCKDYMPEKVKSLQSKSFAATLYYYSNRKTLMCETETELQKKNLFYFTVKGFSVAENYPKPALRTMADCDIVTRREDMKEVITTLRSLGFSGSVTTTHEQWGGERNQLHFEVHDRLVQEGEYASPTQAAFFNRYDKYVTNHSLDSSFHFLFLLMHLRKHFLNRGVGIRQFMDLAVMIRNVQTLRWDWMEEQLCALGLADYAHACYALVDRWFGIKAPIDYPLMEDNFAELVTEKILSNGVFGFSNKENRRVNGQTALLITKGPFWLRKAKIVLKKAFLNYEIMRGYPGYSFVDGKPWLLPIAWGKRFTMILTTKDKTHIISSIKSSSFSKDEMDAREKLLRGMGLI